MRMRLQYTAPVHTMGIQFGAPRAQSLHGSPTVQPSCAVDEERDIIAAAQSGHEPLHGG
jgi:hypothetical protein